MNLVNTYEKIFETVLHNYTCDDVELNLLYFEFLFMRRKQSCWKFMRNL